MALPMSYQGPPAQFPVQQRVTERRFVFLALACTVLGLTIPAVAPWMLVGAGALSLRATRLVGKFGFWCLGVGLFLMMFGVLIPPYAFEGLARLTSLAFTVMLIMVTIKSYRTGR